MSATLLEFAIGIIILVVAWQLGIAIAPDIFRLIQYLRREVDQVAEQAESETDDLPKK
ncbi:MAG: hypothetical protein SH847_02145 [Roseiflexaceae bacterium]|nr:hypothetical protein [Roseiflexaceae bacterium]